VLCVALLKTLIGRLPFEGHRETALIPHVQDSTRLYPDRVVMGVFELKTTAMHTAAQSAYVPIYCVSTEMGGMFPSAFSGSHAVFHEMAPALKQDSRFGAQSVREVKKRRSMLFDFFPAMTRISRKKYMLRHSTLGVLVLCV